MRPCTPSGVMRLLAAANIPIKGAHAVVIGRSNIVGKPMAMLLLHAGATVTICHSQTKNLAGITRQADILVAAVGHARFVKKDMVKPGATVIDVGINRGEDGKLCGDVDFDAVRTIAGALTPVPGGVGPMTVAMLIANAVAAAGKKLPA
jgi:methylenetetrahydrofolate dehydrogenase (NADP+)/methenyltetrahydrofolate cyclohydrolase